MPEPPLLHTRDWHGKTVLITGVCGTVGAELLRQLLETDVLDIILNDTGRRFNSLPFQSISDIEIPDPCYSPVILRRRGVQFVDLTSHQQSDLENFIHQNLTAADSLPH